MEFQTLLLSQEIFTVEVPLIMGLTVGSQSFLLHTQIFLHVPLLQVVSAILLEKTQENGVKASYVE